MEGGGGAHSLPLLTPSTSPKFSAHPRCALLSACSISPSGRGKETADVHAKIPFPAHVRQITNNCLTFKYLSGRLTDVYGDQIMLSTL